MFSLRLSIPRHTYCTAVGLLDIISTTISKLNPPHATTGTTKLRSTPAARFSIDPHYCSTSVEEAAQAVREETEAGQARGYPGQARS